MRAKTLLLFLIAILAFSCAKEQIEELNVSAIKESIQDDDLPDDPEVESTSTNLSKATNWIKHMQSSNGLLESSENMDFVSLYDNALSALVFMEVGEIEKAEHIFDYFNSKLENEFLNGGGGFYQFRDANGENGERIWMGDNAWLLIALNQYHFKMGNDKYQTMAHEINLWLRSLQDIDGGLWGGLREDGTIIPKITEGIITAFNAVDGYDDFHENILIFLKNNRWDSNDEILLAWPENPTYVHALDLHSLGELIFENYPQHNLELAALYRTTQISTVNGMSISGFCFDEDKDVVWLEGTAQVALADKIVGNEFEANAIIAEIEKSFIPSFTISDSQGLPYTCNYGTNFGSNLLWEYADLTPALSSTAWYIFAKKGFNPLGLGRHKEIPREHSFWTIDL